MVVPCLASSQSLSTLVINPSTVAGGLTLSAKATITYKAGTGGFTFNVTSNASFVTVPANVTVPAGANSTQFTISTSPVSATSRATITAISGLVQMNRVVTVNPATFQSFSVSPLEVLGSVSSTGTVTLSSPAPSGGVPIAIKSNKSFATPPATVTIPAGYSSATFSIPTVAVGATGTATITATFGSTSFFSTLQVDPLASWQLNLPPGPVYGGLGYSGTVVLPNPAPPAGVTIYLSSNSSLVGVPATVKIGSGGSKATFAITTTPVSTQQAVMISALSNGTAKTASFSLLPTVLQGITITPANVVGGSSATGTVTLSSPAPTGGTIVTLTSSNSQVVVPATVIVPAGASMVTFSILTKAVGTTLTSKVTATLGTLSFSAPLIVTNAPVKSLTISPGAIHAGSTATATVKLTTPVGTGGSTYQLASSQSYVTVPTSLTVAAGATTATFQVTTDPNSPDANGTSLITITDSADRVSTVPLHVVGQGYALSAWPAFHGGGRETGCGWGNRATGKVTWSFNLPHSSTSPAIGADGTIYVTSDKLYAINSSSHQLKWSFKGDAKFTSSPSVGQDGTVYAGDASGTMYAISGQTGTSIWSFSTGGPVYSAPAIGTQGYLFFGSDDKSVYALRAKTGALVWKYQTSNLVESMPAIQTDGTVMVGCWDTNVYVFNPLTGTVINTYTSNGPIKGAPVSGDNGALYYGSGDGNLYSLDGNTPGSFPVHSPVSVTPALGLDNSVYFNGDNGTFFGLFPGGQWWSLPFGGPLSSPVVTADGAVYVGNNVNSLWAVDSQKGVFLWGLNLGAPVSSPALAADGTIYVIGDKLYAIK